MKSIRVLIVDDLPQVREGLASVLTLAGNHSERRIEVAGFAGNGLEAIERAREILPDVILMDLEMSGMDGYAATRHIKENLPEIRVIILSIHDDSEAQQRAWEAGANGFVTKGDRYEILLAAITATSANQQDGEKS